MSSGVVHLEWEECRSNYGPHLERARVPGGWLYRGVRLSPASHVTALAFVPDPPVEREGGPYR